MTYPLQASSADLFGHRSVQIAESFRLGQGEAERSRNHGGNSMVKSILPPLMSMLTTLRFEPLNNYSSRWPIGICILKQSKG